MIYKNQPLQITFTDTDGTDLSTLTLRVDYWNPAATAGSAATGSISSGITVDSEDTATCSWTFAANLLSSAGDWRYQLVDAVNDIPWDSQIFNVWNRGW